MTQGEINRRSILGDMIYDYASEPDIKTIVDIGTWNGLGTTKCVIDAIIDSNKSDYKFISIEANENAFPLAKKNLAEYNEYVDLQFGRITNVDDLTHPKDYDTSLFQQFPYEMQLQWFEVTLQEHETAPYIFDKLPDNIDLLILDGGEYSTYGEFVKLKDRFRTVILDDTNTIKNYNNANYLRRSDMYTVIYDNPNDRNGCMVAKNGKL